MKFALFLGCNIPARLKQYESSTRAVLGNLGVELVDIKEFNCCGYPMRNIDFKTSILAAARNLALAEKQGLNMIVLCMCGYGMLKKADHAMKEEPSLREVINTTLKKEGLQFRGDLEIRHLLCVLYNEVSVEAIRQRVTRPFKELKIATHYGCHALRPSEIVQFDDPVNPTLFDKLVEATGAQSIYWQSRLDCCGAPLFGINDNLSMDLAEKKLLDAKRSGAHYLCDACTYCHLQFDTVQEMISTKRGENHLLPAILYPQLLGLSMGIDERILGLEMNHIDISGIKEFLSE
ncbi:MAG: CoB--CoM heterodisulfide reductase iron-sulfur subunit B family protein [Deltaproteobacteria bacterium]|nr:CoB--CoM heterodisulfide reductase iron-sulfur subunit B family protein [Deltaproteobacteria bacterium]